MPGEAEARVAKGDGGELEWKEIEWLRMTLVSRMSRVFGDTPSCEFGDTPSCVFGDKM